MLKSLFQLAFGVCSTQMLIKIYNTYLETVCLEYSLFLSRKFQSNIDVEMIVALETKTEKEDENATVVSSWVRRRNPENRINKNQRTKKMTKGPKIQKNLRPKK